ncbi:MAG TPA: response regulator transcription factor [Verrucomicrobiae bacterium]|nr:response regulator transcription factor [Verrucomicrobiae bacterium]
MGQTDDLKLSSQVSVYLLTENRLLRDTLARLLRKRSEINVVGVSRHSESTKDEIISSHCDVVLTDCFDDTARSTFLRDVLEQNSGVKLLLFGMNEDPDVFLKAVYVGICGYLLKDASAAEIVAAVHAAVRGEATCPPSLCMALIQHLSKMRTERSEPSHPHNGDHKALTPRQLQLIRLVANGLTNKEIAANLNLSQFTVKNHIRRVMRQVEAASRYDAVNLVRATGQLTTP